MNAAKWIFSALITFQFFSAPAEAKLMSQNPWVRAAMTLKDSYLNKYLETAIQEKGERVLENPAFRRKVNSYVANKYRIDLEKRSKRLIKPPQVPATYFAIASLSTVFSLFGEKDNQPASAVIGGGKASSGGVPNAANILLSGGYNISEKDKVSSLYMHSYRYRDDEIRPGKVAFLPPEHIFGLGYTRQLLEPLTFDFAYTYLDTTGIQDPTLKLQYAGKLDLYDNSFGWTVGLGGSLPFSYRSRETSKQTTLSTNGALKFSSGPWEVGSRVNYSYTFYKNPEYLLGSPSDEDEEGAAGVATGGNLYEEYEDEYYSDADLPSYEINYLSREMSGTKGSLTAAYKFSPMWKVGSAGVLSYSYLNSTYSRWASNITVLSIEFRFKGLAIDVGATLTSSKDKREDPTFPEEWGGRLSIAYTIPLLGAPAL